jgi:hypothetical protein
LADGPPGGFSASDEQMSDDSEKRSKPISFNVMPVQNEQIERAAAVSEGLATASYVRRVVVTLKRPRLSRPCHARAFISDLIIVRFGPPCGLKSDISQGPRSADFVAEVAEEGGPLCLGAEHEP